MKKHRRRTKPLEVLFPVYSDYILTNHKELSRVVKSLKPINFRQSIYPALNFAKQYKDGTLARSARSGLFALCAARV